MKEIDDLNASLNPNDEDKKEANSVPEVVNQAPLRKDPVVINIMKTDKNIVDVASVACASEIPPENVAQVLLKTGDAYTGYPEPNAETKVAFANLDTAARLAVESAGKAMNSFMSEDRIMYSYDLVDPEKMNVNPIEANYQERVEAQIKRRVQYRLRQNKSINENLKKVQTCVRDIATNIERIRDHYEVPNYAVRAPLK